MATVYSTATDNGAVAGTQDPGELATLTGAVTGVTADEELADNNSNGGHVTKPNMGFAGAHQVINDATYVDGDDGKLGAGDAARFVPGHGYSQGYRREVETIIADDAASAQTTLEPVGKSADFDLID